MKRLVLATQNKGKIKEIQQILGHCYSIMTMDELGYHDDIVEDGETFAENAEIKTSTILNWGIENNLLEAGDVVLAEDSGFCVAAIPNELGVYSARFMGKETSYELKNAEIIKRLAGLPIEERTCSYIADICVGVVTETLEKKISHFEGEVKGYVGETPYGEGGFAYDPIFYLYGPTLKTMASISSEEKNKISHRGQALKSAVSNIEISYLLG